jgi:ribonuclease P protein component
VAVGVAPNGLALNRMAVRLRKGIKPAVLRNRLKRLIREAFRSQAKKLKPGFDFVLSVLVTKEVNLYEFKEDLQKLCSRARLLSQEK